MLTRSLVGVVLFAPVLSIVGAALAGCGSTATEEPYKATPAWSGRKPSLPPPTGIPPVPQVKTGDPYDVKTITHHLKSRIHDKEVTSKPITVVGYIVDSNIPKAPKCAVHPTGKKDPEGCVTEIPSFWIGDEKSNDKQRTIRVLGWASNFANVYDAMQKYKNVKECPRPDDPKAEKLIVKDEFLATPIPCPLPAVGAKVKLTGKYGFSYERSNMVSDPNNGVFTFEKMEVIEPAPEPAAFDAKK
jgi:hypothetical protein